MKRHGMLKPISKLTFWSSIKSKVKALNPAFYNALEACSPGDNLPLLTVQYPYGFKLSDDKGFYLPEGYDDFLEGDGFDKKAPLTFVLDKEIEYYFNTSQNHIQWRIYKAGDYFPITVNSELDGDDRFYPKSIFTVTSGIRDVTLLSLHGTTKDFYSIRRKYEIPVELSPSKPLNHFHIFKKIIEKENIKWYSTVLLFSKEWQHKIYNEPSWWPFREYLMSNASRINSFQRSIFYLDQAIHDITRSMDYKFRPFTHEAIRQLIFIAVGQSPGFRPATSDEGFPVDEVSQALKQSSKELLNHPIIMQASTMDRDTRKKFIYSSITYNTSTRYESSVKPNLYLNEIIEHLNEYLLYFKDHAITKGTIYETLYDNLEIIPCSTRGSEKHQIKKCIEMYDTDSSFHYARDTLNISSRNGAPINAQFCKGFFGIRWK
jgi:hypothetical protein